MCTTIFSYVHNTFFVCGQRLDHDAFVSVASLLRAPGGTVRLDSGCDILPGEVLPFAVRLVPTFHRHFVYAKRTEAPSVKAP
jgi:hypothetical protein